MIYLDNSATTRMSEAAVAAMLAAVNEYANPSSLHAAGTAAAKLLSDSREQLLRAAGLKRDDGWHAIFTGSGSEATNLCIRGAAFAKTHFDSKRIIITDSEHPSVTNSAKSLSPYGFETVTVPTRDGKIDMQVLEDELKKGAFLVSLMLVNNETGALYDIPAAFSLARRLCPGAILHCDAVQGFIRVPLPVKYADAITVSAHKIHGPKGCGALLVSPALIKRKALSPVIFGGGQEEGLRSGTENLPCIAAFGAAAAEGAANSEKDSLQLRELHEYAAEQLCLAGARVNIPQSHVNHILSVTMPSIKSQTVLSFLSAKEICVSSGSACSSKDGHVSTALLAYGLTAAEADSTVRVSFCAENTKEDICALCGGVAEAIQRLVRIKR